MRYSNDTLTDIYEKTAGRCHICRKPLALTRYGVLRAGGAWEVDHSRPRARGGTDLRRNLQPACIPCNRRKRAGDTRRARRAYGFTRAPLSRRMITLRRRRNVVVLAIAFAVVGFILGARPELGIVAGALLGAVVGAFIDVE